MIILGIGAKARNGKDTAGEAIAQYYAQSAETAKKHGLAYPGPRVVLMKFATALYKEVNEALRKGLWESRAVSEIRPVENGVAEFITVLPADIQPDPNPEITPLAPYGKHSRLLVWWGTDYRRAQDPDYWVKKALASIPQNTDIAIFTDVRFPNEADAIKALGGHLVEVVRLNQDGTRYYATDRSRGHISETALDGYNWDHYIKTKSPAETGEMAITVAEFIRGLESK